MGPNVVLLLCIDFYEVTVDVLCCFWIISFIG